MSDVDGLRARIGILSRIPAALAAAAGEPQTLFAAITHEVAVAMDAFCSFAKLENGMVVPIVRATSPSSRIPETALALTDEAVPLDGPSLMARTARDRRALRVAELTEAQVRARYPDPAQYETMRAVAPRSLLMLPVVVQGAVEGVLSLFRCGADARPFSDDDVQFAGVLADHAALALTNSRLAREANERALRLHVLSELSGEFAAVTSPQKLLDLIVKRIGETISESCVIRLVRDDERGFEPLGAMYVRDPELQALCDATLHELATTNHPGMAGRVLTTRTSFLAPAVDVAALTASAPPNLRELLVRLAPRSLLSVPLILGHKAVAVLVLTRNDQWPTFTLDDQRFVEGLATHATIAIVNARLLDRSERMAVHLRALTDAATRFAAAVDDPARLLETLASVLTRLFGGLCVIRLLAPDGELAPDAMVVHQDPEVVQQARAGLKSGEKLARYLGATRAPVFVSSSQEQMSLVDQHLDEAVTAGVHNLIGVPLRAGAEVIGALTLTRGHGQPYTKADLELVVDLVGHAALAIRNSRLLAAAQHELEERIRMQNALAESQSQLRHAQKMEAIGRLAGGVAHDFNNLLSIVLSSCEFISDQLPASSPIAEDVEQIRKAGERATKLTRQLLAFSRQQPVEAQILDLNEVIGTMRAMLRRLLGEDIAVATVPGVGLGTVKVDPGHVEQIVMNLSVNARDAMARGGRLTIETANVSAGEVRARCHVDAGEGPYVMLAVTDTGEGIPPEIRDRIFEPFFTTKAVGKGTGLGLSTVYGIVTQNGGLLHLNSEVGKGTRFEIYFPRVDEAPQDLRAAPQVTSLRGSESILVVEDDDAVRHVIVSILSRNGYRVFETRNGSEALEAYDTSGPIDLVLTDVVMPAMGGRQLVDQLTAKRPDLKVLFMSGYTEDTILQHQVAQDGSLLQKPFTSQRLLQKIRNALAA